MRLTIQWIPQCQYCRRPVHVLRLRRPHIRRKGGLDRLLYCVFMQCELNAFWESTYRIHRFEADPDYMAVCRPACLDCTRAINLFEYAGFLEYDAIEPFLESNLSLIKSGNLHLQLSLYVNTRIYYLF